MKKLLAVSLMSLVSTVGATELDLQPGQWAFSVKSVNVNLSGYNNKFNNPDSDSSSTSKGGNLNIQGWGQYAKSEQLTLGFFARVYQNSSTSASETAGTETFTTTTDFDFAIEPSFQYKVKGELAVYGAVYYAADDANLTVDQDGAENYNGNTDYSNLTLWTGLIFKKDYRENMLINVEGLAGYRTRNWVDAIDSNDTTRDTYLLTRGIFETKYFLANNFSVDAGVTASLDKRLATEFDGTEFDYGNQTYNQLRFGTRFGFTYYIR